MTIAQDLTQVRSELKLLVDQASTLPAVLIKGKGLDAKIAVLKQKETALVKQLKQYELTGSQTDAEQELALTTEEEAAKTKKTLIIAGSVFGFLALTTVVIIIIKKSRK